VNARPGPRDGDRVRLTVEGIYRGVGSADDFLIEHADGVYWTYPGDPAELEVLAPAEPPEGTVVVGYDSDNAAPLGTLPWVFQHDGSAWRTTASTRPYSWGEVWRLTMFGRKIIQPTP
jgi:hypothetical protein